jgi:CHAT domain-containing protein/tetratricopeptide (TPR) repeat protein
MTVAVVTCLLALPPLAAQELPQESPAGKKALAALLEVCDRAGALRRARAEKGGQAPLVVADAAGLRKLLKARRDTFTAELRDTLIARTNVTDLRDRPALLELLRQVAIEAGDERARAFAAMIAGGTEMYRGNDKGALPHLGEAARRFADAKDPLWQANTLNKLGLAHNHLGQYDAALDLHRQALKLFVDKYGEKHGNVIACYSNIASVHRILGNHKLAKEEFLRVLWLEEELFGEDSERTAVARLNLAATYADIGEHTAALKEYQKAVLLLREAPGGRNASLANALVSVAIVYETLGQADKALSRTDEALQILQGLHDGPHSDVAHALRNRGMILLRLGRLGEARSSLEQSLAIGRKVFGAEHPEVASTLNALGNLPGDRRRALTYFEESLHINRKFFGPSHPEVALNLFNLGATYAHLGEKEKSLGYFRQTVDSLLLDTAKAGRDVAELAPADFFTAYRVVDALYSCGMMLTQLSGRPANVDKLREAAKHYAKAAEVSDYLRYRYLEQDPSKLVLIRPDSPHFLLMQTQFLIHGLGRKDQDLERAFAALELGLARVFLEKLAASRAHVLGGVPAELRARRDELAASLSGLNARVRKEKERPLEKQDDRHLMQILQERRRLEAAIDGLHRRLEREYPQYAALKYPRPCSLAEARAALNEDEVALVFSSTKEVTYLILIEARPKPGDPSGGVAVVILPGRGQLAPEVAALTHRDTLGLPGAAREAGARLHKLLLGKIAGRVKGKHLVIVPSGPLCHLPFELLVKGEGEAARYLVEGHRVRYAPSLTVLHLIRRWQQARRPPPQPLWALGDPLFGPAPAGGLGAALKEEGHARAFVTLPNSGAEVRAVAQLLGAPAENVLLGKDATEANVKQASAAGRMAQARYVLFATHGILGIAEGFQPSLVLNQVGNQGEDGFLQLDEVAGLQLNADLVVLSACETGKGKLHQGEGVTGLARAFLYAGSKGVLCSLWTVDDKESSGLVVEVFRHLRAGRTAPEALRQAQLDMIRAGKSPLFWAPFIVIGE